MELAVRATDALDHSHQCAYTGALEIHVCSVTIAPGSKVAHLRSNP